MNQNRITCKIPDHLLKKTSIHSIESSTEMVDRWKLTHLQTVKLCGKYSQVQQLFKRRA